MRRLILRPGAIGDCILCFPAMEHLRADYTEVWVPSPFIPLIRFADKTRALAASGIDLAGVGDLAMPAALLSELKSFDSIVSWYGTNRPEFRAALSDAGVVCRFLDALPPANFEQHATDFFADQVDAARGLAPRIQISQASRRDSVVIHPFSGSARKNWPLHAFRSLAAKLRCPVEWTAGPQENLPKAQRFGDLAELGCWLSGARLYIGNDSGITHLAAAVGVTTLALFGPTDPTVWAPRGAHVTVLRCEPLKDLAVAKVVDEVNRLLG